MADQIKELNPRPRVRRASWLIRLSMFFWPEMMRDAKIVQHQRASHQAVFSNYFLDLSIAFVQMDGFGNGPSVVILHYRTVSDKYI